MEPKWRSNSANVWWKMAPFSDPENQRQEESRQRKRHWEITTWELLVRQVWRYECGFCHLCYITTHGGRQDKWARAGQLCNFEALYKMRCPSLYNYCIIPALKEWLLTCKPDVGFFYFWESKCLSHTYIHMHIIYQNEVFCFVSSNKSIQFIFIYHMSSNSGWDLYLPQLQRMKEAFKKKTPTVLYVYLFIF